MKQVLLYENVESMVKVMPRIEALYYFIYELAETFHADENTLEKIKIGVLDNQIINSITLSYKKRTNENAGQVVIKIDWDKHFLLVKTDEGNTLEFDLSKSIVDNIVDWKKIVAIHIDEIIKQFNVTSVEGSYTYRADLYKSDTTIQKVREIMKTRPATANEGINEQVNPEFQKELDNIFQSSEYHKETHSQFKKRSFDCGIMEEVSVDVYYRL